MKAHGRVGRCGVGMSLLGAGWGAFMVLALPLSATETAQGDIVTLQVTGTVTSIHSIVDPEQFDLDGSVVIGSPYQLTFVIDTDAPDLEPGPVKGRYLLLASSGQLGSYAWSRTEPPIYSIRTTNDEEGAFGAFDAYTLLQPDPEFSGTFILGGEPTLLDHESFKHLVASIDLMDLSANALDSDALVIPSLADWGRSIFSMRFQLDEATTGFFGAITVDGTVDSITTPEPGAAAVMVCLLTTYAMRRRDRRSICKSRPVHTSGAVMSNGASE